MRAKPGDLLSALFLCGERSLCKDLPPLDFIHRVRTSMGPDDGSLRATSGQLMTLNKSLQTLSNSFANTQTFSAITRTNELMWDNIESTSRSGLDLTVMKARGHQPPSLSLGLYRISLRVQDGT